MLPFNIPGIPFVPPMGIPPGFPLPPIPGLPVGNLSGIRPSQNPDEEMVHPPEECEPNETLYVNNLNCRVKERELREYTKKVCKLFTFAHVPKVFSRFGKCEVIAMSSLRRRGQVWVIFESVEDAQSAMNELQGQLAFGKKMRISFSRNISDKTRERKGMAPREKRTEPFVARESAPKKQAEASFFETTVTAPKTTNPTYNPPNRILFIENLSETCTSDSVTRLFSQFDGFVEVRLIPSRGVGFAEFVDEYKSQEALAKLQGKEIEKGRFLMISNAKR